MSDIRNTKRNNIPFLPQAQFSQIECNYIYLWPVQIKIC